jgi:hypothetical protein
MSSCASRHPPDRFAGPQPTPARALRLIHNMRLTQQLDNLYGDVRLAIRELASAPGFTFIAAAVIFAWRASRIDPVVAFRQE